MSKVRILGIVGSPRENSNTEVMVREALRGAEEAGEVETEILLMAGKKIDTCKCCYKCKENKDFCYYRYDDDMHEVYEKYLPANGLIIGSPVYHLSISGILKNAIDRLMAGCLAKYEVTGLPWFCKVGGVLTQGAAGFGGQEYALQYLVDHLMLMNNIPVSPDVNAVGIAGTFRWSLAARQPGVIAEYDPDAVKLSRRLGRRVAEVTKIVRAGVETLGNRLPEEYLKNILQGQEFYSREVMQTRKR